MSGVDWGERNDPQGFADLMEKFTESEYRLISATVLRVAECIEGMKTIKEAVQYCTLMSKMTYELAEKKAAATETKTH